MAKKNNTIGKETATEIVTETTIITDSDEKIDKWEALEKILNDVANRKSGNTAPSTSIGLLPLFALLLTVLKCTGYISCSWWLVLAPMYIPIAFAMCAAVLILCGCLYMLRDVDNGK